MGKGNHGHSSSVPMTLIPTCACLHTRAHLHITQALLPDFDVAQARRFLRLAGQAVSVADLSTLVRACSRPIFTAQHLLSGTPSVRAARPHLCRHDSWIDFRRLFIRTSLLSSASTSYRNMASLNWKLYARSCVPLAPAVVLLRSVDLSYPWNTIFL